MNKKYEGRKWDDSFQFKIHLNQSVQGARWDINTGSIADSKLKELHPNMPVMFIKAVTQV